MHDNDDDSMIHPFSFLTVDKDLPDDLPPVLGAVLHQPFPYHRAVVDFPAGLGSGGGATTATRRSHAIGDTCTKFSIWVEIIRMRNIHFLFHFLSVFNVTKHPVEEYTNERSGIASIILQLGTI